MGGRAGPAHHDDRHGRRESLVPLDDVRAFVFERVGLAEPLDVPIGEALGLFTAADIVAPEPVPPFANSAMDGYAVRSADCVAATDGEPVRLKVVDEVPAGKVPDRSVGVGEAIRIMTGAAVPEGADGIVIVEHTERAGREVVVRHPAGDHIRPAGGDVAAGDLVFPTGTAMGPAHLGVLASLGVASVSARPRPRVGVLSTGDELVPAGEPLAPGKIRESNRPMLLALVERSGFVAVDLGIAADDPDTISAAIGRGVAECDAVVTTGGVSMGDYDEVKGVLDRMGEMRWFQVAIKPGKPFAFGLVSGVPVFGLPGNPVSSFVSFELFALPALLRRMGHPHPVPPLHSAVAGEDLPRRADGKTHFDRVRAHHDGQQLVVARSGAQASNVLSAMARANALAVVPDGDGVRAGERVDVMLLDVPPTLLS